MVQETTVFKIDKATDRILGALAKNANRTKIGELRYLVKKEITEIGLKLK